MKNRVSTHEVPCYPVNVEISQQLQMTQNNGVFAVKVINVSETTAIVDANHRLAEEDLTFEIELVEIG